MPNGLTSPTQVARKLHELHERRAHGEIAALLTPESRESTITYLVAIDQVIDARKRLAERAAQCYGSPPSEAWGLGDMENNLGPFSRAATIIGESFSGDDAIVTLQEGSYVPLVRARFRACNGTWLYAPPPPPLAKVPELLALARTLNEMVARAEGGMEFEPFLDAFLAEVPPQIRRVVAAGSRARAVAMTPEP